MRAATRSRFGGPQVVSVTTVEKPELAADGILVRVRAASLNKADWYALTGTPWVARMEMGIRSPKTSLLGGDYAGIVEEVGPDATGFAPGDEVFGGKSGAIAEYLVTRQWIAPKPPGLSFEEAASIPTAGVTALQALRDHCRLEPGQHVLINGASGGVGTFAVQIAKAMDAEVTAVCSTANVDLARSLGADHVIDYTAEDFTRTVSRYDLAVDVSGGRSYTDMKRILAPKATVVVVGGPSRSRLLGPLGHIARIRLGTLLDDRRSVFFIAKFNRPDFDQLSEMVEAGSLRPVIDRVYPIDEIVDALTYLGRGHTRGKVAVTI
jgi:NADPH:quinone reductase-like Zn-dependent oxidoreductase